MMPDVVRTNNSSKDFKLNFIFDNPEYYRTDINIIPWLFTYNTYNSFLQDYLHGTAFYQAMVKFISWFYGL